MSTGTSRPLFERLLIANRGEIAVRIIRACRDLGIQSVAVYSDADAGARHVLAADLAVRIGPAPAAESYLRADRLVAAALETGAQAVHPGYGFLSEQSAFAAAVEAAGLVFIGPTALTLASLGDKIAARRSARAIGVPIVPGTFEPLPAGDPSQLSAIEASAADIGYPLLVKASAGGGGRGMRRVDAREDLLLALLSASREAAAAFGSGSVYLERYVEGGRHIEVQLLGDSQGTILALGERDCSVQRRHQKLVEEAPAPGLSTGQRRRLHELAVRVAGTVGLRNAATAEFLFAPDGEAYFLEVNARLQVEHGVTELVSGVDLVHEQIAIAAGAPLSAAVVAASKAAATPSRHAIELRVSAEDPARSFAPTPGRITAWREPSGPGVRVDSGVELGWRVTGDYDPLLAKLMVVAADRPGAIARARRAVHEFETGGVQTTLAFHAWLLGHPAFVDAELRTDLIERDWNPEPLREAAARRAAAVVASALFDGGSGGEGWGASSAPVGDAPTGRDRPLGPGWPERGADDWLSTARREGIARWP